ncbi:MAG: ABC transporter permease [Spirosomataceae bacterium]
MIRHLIVVTFRSFTRNKSSFLINLLSLSAGLVGVLLIMLWINDELQKDKFYANDNLLFQVVNQWKEDDQINTSYFTHGPLAAAIKEEIPEVKAAANVVHWFDKFNISVNEKSFSENGFYVGKEFFDVFGFKLKIGNVKGVFQKPNSVAISEKLAIKYFQNPENAIGKTIKLENQKELTISSVFANLPQWSTLQFDFLMSFEDFVAQPQNAHRNKWETTGPYTMLTLTKGADKQQVANKIKHVVQSHFKEPLELRVVLKPFSEVYLYGQYDKTGTLVGGRIQYVKLFGIIGVFLLLISCFNFISLSVAQATKRIKEVGIKKNLGASRLELAIQYFFESSFLCFLALMSALGIVYLFLPTFSRFTEKNLDGLLSIETIGVLTGLIGIMSLMAGAYPAFYLSSFKPLKILKGDILPGKGGEGIRKILVVTQFAISVTLMIGVTVVYQQIAFVQNTNLGYKKDNLVQVILNLENRDQITAFIEEVKQLSGVINISSGNTPINHQNRTSEISWKGKDENRETAFYFYGAHFDLLETLGIQIKRGGIFQEILVMKQTRC